MCAIALIAVIGLTMASCGMSKETAQKKLKTMFQEFMDTDSSVKRLHGKVTDVTMVKVAANENNYKGEFTVSVLDKVYKVPFTAIADKDAVQYEIEDGKLKSIFKEADTVTLDGLTFRLDNDGSGFLLIGIADKTIKEVNIPATVLGISVTVIGQKTFYESYITSVTIPNTVVSIGQRAFWDSDITSIIIPDSVKSIADEVFYLCSRLTSVTLGNSVTKIGDEAFRFCPNLTSVTFQGLIPSSGFHREAFAAYGYNGYTGDLRDKYLAGGIGTYTRAKGGQTWTKQ